MKKLTKFHVGPIYIVSYVLQLLLQTLVLAYFQAVYGSAYKDGYSWTFAIVLVNGLSFLAAAYGYAAVNKIPLGREMGLKKKLDGKMTLMIIPVSVFTICTTMPLANWFVEGFSRLGYDLSAAAINMPQEVGPYLLMSLFLSLMPAVCEETMFRGVVATGLKRQGAAFAVVVSAAMFALMHGNPVQLVHQFGIGIMLAVVILVSGDIKYAMLFHFLNNMISCLASICFPKLDGIAFDWWQVPVGLVVMAAGFYMLMVCVKAFAARSVAKHGGQAEPSAKTLFVESGKMIATMFKKGGLKRIFNDINCTMRLVTPDMDDDNVDEEVYSMGKKFTPMLICSFVILVVMWVVNTAAGF